MTAAPPAHDVEPGPDAADVIACHIQQGELPRVDVLHCHSLYYHDIAHAPYQAWHHEANARIAAAASSTRAITVPSDWVAGAVPARYALRPHVINHRIDLDAWTPAEHHRLCAVEQESRRRRVRPGPAYAGRAWRAGGLDLCARGRAGAEPDDRGRAAARDHARTHPARRSPSWRPPARRLGSARSGAGGRVPCWATPTAARPNWWSTQVSGYLVQPGDVDGLVAGWRGCGHPECRERPGARRQNTRGRGRSNSTPRSITTWPNSDGSQPGLGGDHQTTTMGGTWTRAVQSCLDQTRLPDHIVLVDDAVPTTRPNTSTPGR